MGLPDPTPRPGIAASPMGRSRTPGLDSARRRRLVLCGMLSIAERRRRAAWRLFREVAPEERESLHRECDRWPFATPTSGRYRAAPSPRRRSPIFVPAWSASAVPDSIRKSEWPKSPSAIKVSPAANPRSVAIVRLRRGPYRGSRPAAERPDPRHIALIGVLFSQRREWACTTELLGYLVPDERRRADPHWLRRLRYGASGCPGSRRALRLPPSIGGYGVGTGSCLPGRRDVNGPHGPGARTG